MVFHWQFDPVAFSLGPLSVRWYGLLFVGAFLCGQWLLSRLFKAERRDPAQAEGLLLYALVGTLIGARLVHCLFYDPAYYLSQPLAILKVWEGGLASHGGALGLLAGLWLGGRRLTPPPHPLWLLDRVAIPAALGGAFVRLANFLNSEIVGRPTSGDWGVVFTAVDALPRHPVQLYEAASCLLVFVILLAAWWRWREATPRGLLFGGFLLLVFSARIVAEAFKQPQAAYEAGWPFTVGQGLSLPFVLAGLVFVVRAWRQRPR